MWPVLALLVGLAMTSIGWVLPRWIAGTKLRWNGALALDMLAPFGLWALLLAASARPIFAGVASLAVFGGFAFADITKRETLREPVVFSDMSEIIELFRHPELYLPFAGPGLVIGGFAAVLVALVAMLWVEPTLWPWTFVPGVIGFALVALITFITSRNPGLARCARLARSFNPTYDALADAARLGPLAMLPIHGTIARAERDARRKSAPIPKAPPRAGAAKPPIVVIQGESFFDARRLHPAIPTGLLAAFDDAARTGVQAGRFGVSGWGAYTIRAEFAVLTGLSETALGHDRWNPYHAFARAPIASLASRLREEGYRTVCLHPFDKAFYGRNKILPLLGFDEFIGEEAFAGAKRIGDYVADSEIARVAGEILRDRGQGLFLFIITMENHGPWLKGDPRLSLPDPAPELPSIPERDALRCFLNGIGSADGLLRSIRETLRSGTGGIVALYGDHMPSLPQAFDALGFHDGDTDYVIWDTRGGPGSRRDLQAHEFAAALQEARTIT